MGEFAYIVFVVLLIFGSLAILAWANLNFTQASARLGLIANWGSAIASSRFGLSCAMIGAACLGLASLPPRLMFYPEAGRPVLLVICGFAIVCGLLYDLVAAPARTAAKAPRRKKGR